MALSVKELQIGDWVEMKLSSGTNWFTDKVGCLNLDNNLDYKPIPITAEILEKNGFVNDASYDECIADYCFVTIQLWRYHEENILIDWDGRITRVTHDMANLCESVELRDAKVHELQHALRLCGLNELADNFKV